jgi:prepilin-type N-terminal cleavage/methylation domain-containing protein
MASATASALGGRRQFGFTLPEVLVVTGVIALLIAVLLPALSGAKRTAEMADSQNRMRQVDTFIKTYSAENREYIVPSQFDYSIAAGPPQNFPVKVRSHASLGSLQYEGTWTDILWTENGLGGSNLQLNDPGLEDKYLYDSPDQEFYDKQPNYDQNPFRAAAANSRDYPDTILPGTPGALPFGSGAQEIGLPGYFAANDFFNARPDAPALPDPDGGPATPTPSIGRWYVTGQIKAPDRSMYLVDSVAGETISYDGPIGVDSYKNDPNITDNPIQVDFRYNGVCLMLYLDGHTSPEAPWKELLDLEGCEQNGAVTPGRGIRIRALTRRGLPPCN